MIRESRICRAPCGDGGGSQGGGADGPGPDLGGWGGPDTVGQNPNSGMGHAGGPGGEGSGNGVLSSAQAAAKVAETAAQVTAVAEEKGRRSRKGARFDNAILGIPGVLNVRSNSLF